MNPFETIYNNVNASNMRSEVKQRGWSVLGNINSKNYLDDIRNSVDTLAQDADTEVNYEGSEHRVWKAHFKNESIDKFRQFSDRILSDLLEKPQSAYDILAIRNRVIDPKEGELVTGRWHLDSFNRQLKVFTFLSDVSEESGPFEMLSGTHAMSFKVKEMIKGNVITFSDLINGSRRYAKLGEDLINSYVDRGFEKKTFVVPAGTVAVFDTSCVHRARPCAEGERYALTSYYH